MQTTTKESVCDYIWQKKPMNERLILALMQRHKISDNAAQIFLNRASSEQDALESVEQFLRPMIKNLMPNPSDLLDLDKAVDIIISHIARGNKITIFGDYDVDGATSTSLLIKYFHSIGYHNVDFYIPNRMKEGYGPSITGFERIIDSGANLIITVDCGTLSFEPVAFAKERGVDVIIVDHHMSDVLFPNADAIINPNRFDETSDLGHLAAVGVAFLLVIALNREIKLQNDNGTDGSSDGASAYAEAAGQVDLMALLDLVALGTVCDVVSLTGLNRAYVVQGIKMMRKMENPGIAALADVAKLNSPIDTYHIGFMLGPRINAAGRIDDPTLGVRLLTAKNYDEAHRVAVKLNELNNDRKDIEALATDEAIAQVEGNSLMHDSAVVFAHGQWHQGVIGIIAGKLKERYNKPAAVISFANESGVGKASARSIKGVDFGSAVANARALGLIEYGGGHAMAAGFTIRSEEKMWELHKFFHDEFIVHFDPLAKVVKYYDLAVNISALNASLLGDIELFEPFGQGNEEPKFVVDNVQIRYADVFGGKHISFNIAPPHHAMQFERVKAVAFNSVGTKLGDFLLSQPSNTVSVVGRVKKNYWQGSYKIQFQIEDVVL